MFHILVVLFFPFISLIILNRFSLPDYGKTTAENAGRVSCIARKPPVRSTPTISNIPADNQLNSVYSIDRLEFSYGDGIIKLSAEWVHNFNQMNCQFEAITPLFYRAGNVNGNGHE